MWCGLQGVRSRTKEAWLRAKMKWDHPRCCTSRAAPAACSQFTGRELNTGLSVDQERNRSLGLAEAGPSCLYVSSCRVNTLSPPRVNTYSSPSLKCMRNVFESYIRAGTGRGFETERRSIPLLPWRSATKSVASMQSNRKARKREEMLCRLARREQPTDKITKTPGRHESNSPAAPTGSPHLASLVSSAPALIPLACTTWADLCFINAATVGRVIVSGSLYVSGLEDTMQKSQSVRVGGRRNEQTSNVGMYGRQEYVGIPTEILYETWEALFSTTKRNMKRPHDEKAKARERAPLSPFFVEKVCTQLSCLSIIISSVSLRDQSGACALAAGILQKRGYHSP